MTLDLIMNKALALFQLNESEQAVNLLNSNLDRATNNEKFKIAHLFLEFGFIQNAKEILILLHSDDPNNSDFKIVLADIYVELEEDDQAMHLLHDIDSTDPNYLQSLLQLADLHQAQGLFEVAEQKLFEAKRHDPNEKIIDLALAELLFSIGKFNQCIHFYERLLKETERLGDISIVSRLAEAYAALGQYEKAFEFFQSANSDDPDMLFKYGLTAFHLKRMEVAISVWERLIKVDPHYYALYYYLGKAYHDEGMFTEAYDIVREGLRYDEHNAKLFYLAAMLAYSNNELKESESFILRAIELNPDDRNTTLFYIEMLSETEEFEKIIQFITHIGKSNVYDPIFEWELARAYNELDDPENAAIHYTNALKTFSKDVIFLKEYGLFLAELGQTENAINILQRYLKIEPMDDDIMEYVGRLKELYEQ